MHSSFNFERPLDENGIPLPVDISDFVGGIAVQRADFKVNIVPRSTERADIIREAWKDAEDNVLDPETKQWITMPPGMKFSTGVVNAEKV